MLILQPWQAGPLVRLSAYLHDLHVADAAERQAEIDKRKADGMPLADDVDWTALSADLQELARAELRRDAPGLREVCRTVLTKTSSALEPLSPPVLPEGVDELQVSFRVMPESLRITLAAAANAALGRYRDVLLPAPGADGLVPEPDSAALAVCERDLLAAWLAYLGAGVARIEGLSRLEGGEEVPHPIAPEGQELRADDADVLARLGLVEVLFASASRFQKLPAKKALRSGLSQQSTSRSSSAPSVQSSDAPASVASAAHLPAPTAAPPTSPAPLSPPTSAHVAT